MRTIRSTHIAALAALVLFTAGCQAWIQRQPAPAPAIQATPAPTAILPMVAPTPTPTPRPLPTATPTQLPVPAADDTAGVRQELLRLHNQVRRGYDLPLYTISPTLEGVAQKQAEYLAGLPLETLMVLGDAARRGPNGSLPSERMRAAGYPFGAGAENWGLFAGWQDAFVSWLNDEQQRQAIISAEYREVGVGIARHAAFGNYVFVVDYAAPR